MHQRIWSTVCSVLLCWHAAQAAILEIPNHDAVVSGISVISGWKCETEGELTISFDGGPLLPLLHGSARADTEPICGDVRNGFVSIMNWGNLSEGTHTAVVYDNGEEFDRATFDVVTYGTDFLRGAFGQCEALNFPVRGEATTVVWNQSTQHFELDEIRTMEEGEGEGGDELDRLLAAQRLAEECPLWDEYFIGEQTPEYIQNCIDLGADHSPGDYQTHPLHLMIQNNNVSAARVLLAAGADLNATHSLQHTPLHYAVSYGGSLAMIELLLEYGADPNIHSQHVGNEGVTVAHHLFEHWGSHWGEHILTVLNLLLDKGADVKVVSPRSRDGATPLHIAVSWAHAFSWAHVREVLQALLDAGADVNARTQTERAEGDYALSHYGETPLHHAAESDMIYQGRLEVLAFLLDNGADPNLRRYDFYNPPRPDATPFLLAMRGREDGRTFVPLSLVQLFLNAGADPNIPYHAGGRTALFFSGQWVKAQREDIERALIAAGADPTYTFTTQNGVQTYTCLTEECWVVQQGG